MQKLNMTKMVNITKEVTYDLSVILKNCGQFIYLNSSIMCHWHAVPLQ